MGLTVLDAGVVIAVLDAGDAHHKAALTALAACRDRGDDLALPASAYAECLVAPSRRGADAIATVDRFVDALPARVEPATRSIAASAAVLRGAHGPALRLPDALVVATALNLGADRILTTDARWPALPVPIALVAGQA
jgi:predicted nucleic acid-binding protein